MFLESLLETSAQAKNRRGWATVSSFLIETAVMGLLILVPLLYTEALPRLGWSGTGIVGPPAGEARPSQARGPNIKPTPRPLLESYDGKIHAPQSCPDHPYQPSEPEQPPDSGDAPCTGLCVPGGTGNGGNSNVLANVLKPPVVEPPKPTPPERVPVISTIAEGMLIRRVQPVYPRPAIDARIQGTVTLRAIIGRDGAIHALQALSGHPLLIPAAVDAVRQWRYRPYLLNGQPVEVETSVTVNFILNR